MSTDILLRVAHHSGGVLYVIAVLLFVSLTVVIERLWFLHRAARDAHAALAELDHHKALNASTLTAWAQRHDGLPTGSVIVTASRLAGRADRDTLAASLEEAVMREAPRIDRFLWVLDTAVTLAPLLGLFGTIVGMFDAFQVLSNPGNAPTQVTGGVAEALIATASGLFVAMIGLVFFNGLHNRVRVVVHQLDTLKTALVNRLTSDIADTQVARETESGLRRGVVSALAQQGA
ncbi:MotA/TolQ/ExbB proton channel family protein [Paraburkholderia diazotrophica]|uniref:Outer membrane transport energization protein ExbB n=1 Tax=Paraburkholderia diazotrophica TaxID=667676 RepID=A0A1H7C2I3_9BURK|nr:MotA/TolQ/ExbB proton channel family protein [Paraburkholderia diazotrophica]SEJ79825.1 outer membrane transport energization protein ExbB [Paraburkholderia diazotrophica]